MRGAGSHYSGRVGATEAHCYRGIRRRSAAVALSKRSHGIAAPTPDCSKFDGASVSAASTHERHSAAHVRHSDGRESVIERAVTELTISIAAPAR